MTRRGGGHQRDVHGIVLLDKPVGITSNRALQRVKRAFSARKAGHTGSLDPLASGLLPICLGQATKVSAYLLDADKRYSVTAQFGSRTDTGDAEGKVVEQGGPAEVPREQLEAALAGFRGPVEQVPPMYSALKHQGKRLYALAREGIEVERKARTVTIHELELDAVEGSRWTFDVSCSKGTYVRTLVEDIAAALGALAHVCGLRRTAAGPFSATDCVALERIEAMAGDSVEDLDALLLPVDAALGHWPAVSLGRDAAWYLGQGQPVTAPGAPTEGRVRLYDREQRFLGIGAVLADGRIAPKRLFRRPGSC